MSWFIGPIIGAVVGGVLSVMAAVGLVSSQSSTPSPVDKPYIVYGSK